MKREKILYWVFTSLISLAFLASSVLYLTGDPGLKEGFRYLGYPAYVIPILGMAKLLGSLALVNPWFPKLKEWAYAGFTFTLIGAIWTHAATHSPVTMPLLFLIVLTISYFFFLRLQQGTAGHKAVLY